MLASIVSENVLIGNSIDVSGRNRFLVADTLFKTLDFIREPSTNTESELNKSMEISRLNILALNGNGTVSIPGRELEPLPIELGNLWKTVYNKWQIYEGFVSDKILSANSPSNSSSTLSPNNLGPLLVDPKIIEELEIRGLDMVDSADELTRQLAGKSRDIASSALFLQIIFCLATVGVVLGIFWMIIKTLKPIQSLEYATSQIRQGNFDLELLKVEGHDELSSLSRSFNEMVESLKANDTMQKEFLSIASHELKTPIQSILGLVEGVKKGYINPDESFDRILRNIRRLQRLVDEILDVSRIESNALFLKMENVRVNKLIMDAVNKIKESAAI